MDWQAKKIQRTIEYVKESGKSLQEVAIERFGLKKSVDEATKKGSSNSSNDRNKQKDFTKQGFMVPSKIGGLKEESEKKKKEEEESLTTSSRVHHQKTLSIVKEATEEQLNAMAADALKAKIKGDMKLYEELSEKLEKTRSEGILQKVVVADGDHAFRPVLSREQLAEADIQTLYQIEKTSDRHQMDRDYARNISRLGNAFQDGQDYADAESARLAGTEFSGSTKKRRRQENLDDRQKSKIIADYKHKEKILDNCWFCVDSKRFDRSSLIASGTAAFLALPKYGALDKHHCLIVPSNHVSSIMEADDDAWEEIRNFKKCLLKMAAESDQSVVFLETSMELGKNRHAFIEAVPVTHDVANDARIYFHKAINECEGEWAQHKKLINTKERGGLRRSVPKGFPYFHVDFGLDDGFAHVIEDEAQFPRDFGKNVLGPLLGLDPTQWRKKSKTVEEWTDLDSRLSSFSARWQPFDWTIMLRSE